MGRLRFNHKPFGVSKRNPRKKVSKRWNQTQKEYIKSYNMKKASWFDQMDKEWDDLESASRRKIILPEEDINFKDDENESETEYESSDEDNYDEDEETLQNPGRLIIIDTSLLQAFFDQNLVCKKCHEPVRIYENCVRRQGLATRIVAKCSPECSSNYHTGFNTSKTANSSKTAIINKMACLGLRSIGRGYSAALKLFSIMNIGKPVNQRIWSKYTNELLEKVEKVGKFNMTMASAEVRSQLKCHNDEIASVATSFDCSWNSRGWQAKQGVVAAIAQENGKIVDVIQKTSFCRECKIKQEARDRKEIYSMQYLECFVSHEEKCLLNHTGSPQV